MDFLVICCTNLPLFLLDDDVFPLKVTMSECRLVATENTRKALAIKFCSIKWSSIMYIFSTHCFVKSVFSVEWTIDYRVCIMCPENRSAMLMSVLALSWLKYLFG